MESVASLACGVNSCDSEQSEGMMPAKRDKQKEPFRVWILWLAVTLTATVSYMAFWHLSPGVTFLVAVVALVASTVAAWGYGRAARLDRKPVDTTAPME